MDSDEAWDRLRTARAGRMATVTPSNRPHVVPFVFVLVEHGDAKVAYWAVDHKPKRSSGLARIRNLEANPAVEFVVDGYEEEWGRLWWVRCSGTARLVDDDGERFDGARRARRQVPAVPHRSARRCRRRHRHRDRLRLGRNRVKRGPAQPSASSFTVCSVARMMTPTNGLTMVQYRPNWIRDGSSVIAVRAS